MLRVERSAVRLFLMGVAGLVLIIAALDVMSVHLLSTAPEMDSAGVLTSRGRNARRTDLIWGWSFLLVSVPLFFAALAGLLRRRPLIELDEEGIAMRLTGPGPPDFVPWTEIRSVRSGVSDDADGGRPLSVLMIDVEYPERLPLEPWGARWSGNRLVLDAHTWAVPPEQVAVHAELTRERHRAVPDPVPDSGPDEDEAASITTQAVVDGEGPSASGPPQVGWPDEQSPDEQSPDEQRQGQGDTEPAPALDDADIQDPSQRER